MTSKQQKTSARDHIEHLRAVHFTLLTVCIGFLIVTSNRAPSELVIASEQAHYLAEWRRLWNPENIRVNATQQVQDAFLAWAKKNPKILKDITKKNSVLLEPTALMLQPQQIKTKKGTLRLEFEGPNWIVRTKLNMQQDSDISWSTIDQLSYTGLLLPKQYGIHTTGRAPPTTLKTFRKIWDVFQDKLSVSIPLCLCSTPILKSVTAGVSMAELPNLLIEKDFPEESISYTLGLYELSEWDRQFLDETCKIETDIISSTRTVGSEIAYHGLRIILPVLDAAHLTDVIDAQAAIMTDYSGRWRHGRFEQAFPELWQVARELETLDLDALDQYLTRQASNAGENFEVFGARIQSEQIAPWGILIVISIQFYFWLHIQAMTKYLQPRVSELNIAWIGLYRALAARIAFVVSALILPITVVSHLVLRAWGRKGGIALLCLPPLASLLLAVVIWSRWRLIQQRQSLKD